jgi:hypothetical protein
MCGDGQLGDGCTSADACREPLTCEVVFDLPAVGGGTRCSECATSADCAGDGICNLSLSVVDATGHKACVTPQSVADAEFCDPAAPDADDACTNLCAPTLVEGLLTVGVCGPCRNDPVPNEGCAPGEICLGPTVEVDGTVLPSLCA